MRMHQESFQRNIDRFDEHDEKAEELYDSVKELFDTTMKNKLNVLGGGGASIRDISELIKGMSSIRSDAISATSHSFNAKMKIEDLELKKQKSESESSSSEIVNDIMRQLTSKLGNEDKDRYNISSNKSEQENKLEERINAEISNGNVKININEKFMKYDFNGITYKYDENRKCTVVLDNEDNIIEDYPQERIPDNFKFDKIIEGVPYSVKGIELETL